MQHMPMAGKQGLTHRIEANGVPFATAEAEAQVMFDAFHKEVLEAKAAISKAKVAGGLLSGPPILPQLLKEMLAYYNEYNPAFANEDKCSGIARTFQKKAKLAGEPGAWQDMLYAALGGKEGCDDPREVLTRSLAGGEPEAEAGTEPE
jgi:hypothetical protein